MPMRKPSDLQTEGRRAWDTITAAYDCSGCELALAELCRTADRLAQIRAAMKDAKAGDLARLVGAETKAQGAWMRLYKALGLHQESEPPKAGRRHA